MKILDLFSGIGGFSLGLERAGMTTAAFCEIDAKARLVLKKHWPGVPVFEDITKLTKADIHDQIDIIAGGFPCQDISLAGKGAGLAGARSGLWFEFHRLIAEIRPRYAIIENVSALRNRGLDAVLRSLAEIGYDAEWHCIPASAVGAPHRRDRVWIIAYAQSNARICDGAYTKTDAQCPDTYGLGSYRAQEYVDGSAELRDEQDCLIGPVGKNVAYPSGELRDGSGGGAKLTGRDEPANCGQTLAYPSGQRQSETGQLRRDEPAQRVAGGSAVVADCIRARLEGYAGYGEIGGGKGQDGSTTPTCLRSGEHPGGWWLSEPDVGRVAHGISNRVDRLKQLGNAVVPQIPELIGRAIMDYENALA
jgi:DNA (cytosine-5)-methyltransferase 1